MFSCPACTLSSVSTLELALDRLCQHVSIDVGCVDAEGGFYSVSNAAGASSPLLSPALAGPGGTAALTEVSLTVPLALSALNDLTDGTNARGFVVQPQSIDVATTAINATGEFLAAVGFVNITVKVRGARRNTQQLEIQHTHTHTHTQTHTPSARAPVQLPLADTYIRTNVLPILTVTQLISAILGVCGAFGACAMILHQVSDSGGPCLPPHPHHACALSTPHTRRVRSRRAPRRSGRRPLCSGAT